MPPLPSVLSHPYPPRQSLPVAPDARYLPEGLVVVRSISATIEFVGGINRPKLVGGSY